MTYRKINNQGEYLPFHGYSAISMCDPDQPIHQAEVFIRSSKLSQYFSPLPSTSYHMTIYNIWCIRQKPIPPLQRWMDANNTGKLTNTYIPKDALYTEFNQAVKLADEIFTSPVVVRPTLAPLEGSTVLLMFLELEDDKEVNLYKQK